MKTLYFEPGRPWENGYVESFNGKLRDELLHGEICYTLREAKIVIEHCRVYYNQVRPHSALGYRPPALETIIPVERCFATLRNPQQASRTHSGLTYPLVQHQGEGPNW